MDSQASDVPPADIAPKENARGVPSLDVFLQTSGAEKREPDNAEDQDREPSRDGEEGEHRRPRFRLAGFGRGFDDLVLSSGCHGALSISVGDRQSPCGARRHECNATHDSG